jgi:hypothetical protein
MDMRGGVWAQAALTESVEEVSLRVKLQDQGWCNECTGQGQAPQVRRPLRSCWRGALAEIYLGNFCSGPEILRRRGRAHPGVPTEPRHEARPEGGRAQRYWRGAGAHAGAGGRLGGGRCRGARPG